MQNPFEAIIANRQQLAPTRQVVQCDYFNPSVQGNAQRLQDACRNIPTLEQCHYNNTTIRLSANSPLSGLRFTLQDILDAFKACYLDQLFDPIIPMYNLMEGFLAEEDHSAQLAQLLACIIADLIAMAPLFLEGNEYSTAAFRPGRLLLLLYPFLFSEKIPFQQLQVEKTSSNTIGYQLVKKLTSMLQSTTVISREDLERLAPLQPHFAQISLQQTIIQILDGVNKSVLDTIAKKQHASNFAEGEGTYISIKVPNSLEYTKLRALGYNVIVKVSGASYTPVFIRTLGIMALMLPQDSSPSIRLYLQNLPSLYRRYPTFFTRTHTLLAQTLDNMPVGQHQVRDPQVDQDFFSIIGLHLIFKTMYKKSRFRDLIRDGARLLILGDPDDGQQVSIYEVDEEANDQEQHRVIDGTGAFITTLTLRAQREYVSNYLINAPPQLEMRIN